MADHPTAAERRDLDSDARFRAAFGDNLPPSRRQQEAVAASRRLASPTPAPPSDADVEPLQQRARAKAYRPNPRLDELADQAAAGPGALTRAGVPLSVRGLVAFHDTFRSAHDQQQINDSSKGARRCQLPPTSVSRPTSVSTPNGNRPASPDDTDAASTAPQPTVSRSAGERTRSWRARHSFPP